MPNADRSPLKELEAAVGAARPDFALEAALKALVAKVPPLEVIRSAARGAASHLLPGAGQVPHGLVALSSATGLRDILEPRALGLAVLQAVSLTASATMAAEASKPALVVRGEVSHLGRSALFAVRRGDLAEAESLFLGIVEEGWERRMAGDILFRAALEDLGDSGHKLIVAAELWTLAEALGFRDSRLLLRPAIQYLVRGERTRAPYEAMLAVLGKEWVDLDALASAAHPLDDAVRGKLATVVAAPSEEKCVEGLLFLLRDGVAPTALLDGIVTEASKRALAAEGYALETAHAFLYAHSARFALTFSRTNERLYALFLAALRVRSPAPQVPSVRVSDAGGEGDAIRAIEADLEARRPAEAAARVRGYLSRGFSSKRLLEILARFASMDSALANQGHNLALANACAAEYAATNAPEVLMVLAKLLAASPRDVTAAKSWAVQLGL
jgi:hypothetical protein